MEFWGVEVQAGKPLTVKSEEDTLIHISQASLECKGKKGESALLYVKVDGKKLVMGTLSQENIPQIGFDLVFEKDFELSHNLEKGSVHFIGYKSPNIDQEGEGDYFSDSEEEEEDVVPETAIATANAVSNVVKADPKQKAKPAEVKPVSDDDDSDEEDESEDDASDSEKGMDIDEDGSNDEEDSEDEEEDSPKKPELSNKKRANESASKTPISAKKAKPAATPQKTEEKNKGGHTATPHPGQKSGKITVNAKQSPKSGGQSFGGSNKKPFNSGKQNGFNKGKGKGNGRA